MPMFKSIMLFLSLSISIHSFAQVTLTSVVRDTPGTGLKDVKIADDETVVIDGSVDVGVLTINGKLSCGSASAEIKAKTIYVNGVFECGSSVARYNGKLIISLKKSDIDPKPFNAYNFRGLIVNPGGKLWLYGNSGRSAHYKLAMSAKVNDLSVKVDGDVSGWKVDDELVIASSSYNMKEAETFKVLRIEGQNTVHLKSSVKKLHWGEKEGFTNQRNAVVTLDERAEIANLTRNILIRPEETLPIGLSGNQLDQSGNILPIDGNSGQMGGHVMVHASSTAIGEAKIDSVEFYHMGQAGIMARYPFHWHKVKNASGQFIKNSSIHRSFQRCITVHQTNLVRVENNVCYDFKGHGFFLEDGNEVDNVITKNLGINAFRPHPHRVLLSSDNGNSGVSGTSYKRFPATSVFWISNPKNTVNFNIAAGSEGVGFWNSFVGGNVFNYISSLREFNFQTKEFDGGVLLATPPIKMDTTDFSFNVAHSTLVGHTWDGSPNQFAPGINGYRPSINNSLNSMDRKLEIANYSPANTPVFKGLVAFKNIHTGVYFRGDSAVFDGAVTADNGWHWFLAANQVVKNSLIVGRSMNHADSDIAFLKTVAGPEYQVGVILYDGPLELDTVDIVNFTKTQPKPSEFDTVPFMTIGGNDKYYNQFKKIKFHQEPYHRLLMEFGEPVGPHYWLDETLTNNVRDLDGSFTGLTGGILVPDNGFSKNSRCSAKNMGASPSFKGFTLCPADYRVTTFWMASQNTGDFTPFLMRRSDGQVSLDKSKWDELDKVGQHGTAGKIVTQLKLMLPSSEGYSYDLMMAPESISNGKGYEGTFMRMYAEKVGVATPPIRIINAGFNCQLTNATKYSTLNELKAANEAGYFTSGNDFHVKMISTKIMGQIDPGEFVKSTTSESPFYYASCEGPIRSKVTGYVDRVTLVNGQARITGWACDYGVSESIQIHVYLGGSAGKGGKNIGAQVASENSEAGVNFACADATMTHHRFTYIVPAAQLNIYGNQKVFVHGISKTGGANSLLTNSGNLRLPAGTVTPRACSFNGQSIASGQSVIAYKSAIVGYGGSCQSEERICFDGQFSGSFASATCKASTNPPGNIMGFIDSVTPQGLIKGWSCEANNPASVKVEVWAGDPAAGGKKIREEIADEVSESGVNTSCGTSGTNVPHRFNIKLTDSELIAAQDKLIYVRGVALTAGKSNLNLSQSGGFKIPRFTVIGYSSVITENGKVYVSGWTCDKGRDRQIDVHFYARATDGSAQMIGGTKANLAAESAVAVSCEDPLKLGHRFKWEVSSADLIKHKGKKVSGYGLSVSGNNNNELTPYGSVTLP